ncbi:ribonuclease III [bacterium]|nr:ribonuclease III [bacterium]
MAEDLALRNYAHIGDAVWEVFVRDFVILKTSNSKQLHKMTTDRVNAGFQKDMLEFISEELTPEEAELARRARNLPIPVGRKSIQHDYRLATAFEVLIGYWYKNDENRLKYFWDKFSGTEFFS